METLNNNSVLFFEYLKTHVGKWTTELDSAKRVLCGFCNQAEQLQLVLRAPWEDSVFKNFPNLRSRLVYKIRQSLEEELHALLKVCWELEEYNAQLWEKLEKLERSCFGQDLTNSGLGPPFPPSSRLLDLACCVTNHFHLLLVKIKFALSNVDFEQEESVLAVKEGFEASVMNEELKGVLRLTPFLPIST